MRDPVATAPGSVPFAPLKRALYQLGGAILGRRTARSAPGYFISCLQREDYKAKYSSSGILCGYSLPVRMSRRDLRILHQEKVSPELNPDCSQTPDTRHSSLSSKSGILQHRVARPKKSGTSLVRFRTMPAPCRHRKICECSKLVGSEREGNRRRRAGRRSG